MRSAGHGQQEALHFRGELAARGFFLCETYEPIDEGDEETDHGELFQTNILRAGTLGSLRYRDCHDALIITRESGSKGDGAANCVVGRCQVISPANA